MLSKRLKKINFLVRFYQKLIGYNPQNKHWCRVVMDEETAKLIHSLPIASLKTLEISGEKWKSIGFKSYKSTSFPDYDVCQTILDEKFDLVIAEQVFEHLLWPYRAGRNIFNMLNEGGHFLITTPFLLRIHNYPVDCSRWTVTGMKYFLAECGFDLSQIVVDGWGNRECAVANLDEWMPYNPKRHSLVNDPEFPLVVWGFSRKKSR